MEYYKKEFIKSVKKFTDNYINNNADTKYEWEHYSDEAWEQIYDLGDVYHTDQITFKGKNSVMSKLAPYDDWFVNWVRREFEQASRRGIEIEIYILGAVIQKGAAIGPDGPADGGWIRYIKMLKE